MSYSRTILLSSLLSLGFLGGGQVGDLTPQSSRLLTPNAYANPKSEPLSPNDQKRFAQILKMAQEQKLASKPMGNIVQVIARQFLGAPYEGGLLDQSPSERLFISLQKFDCVLLIETVLGLARNIVLQDQSPTKFVQNIEAQRYRNGHLKDYCNRLHYFSDWIADGERRGLVQNITPRLGGIPLNKTLNFMTQHRSSYPQLKTNPVAFDCLKQVELNLNQQPLTYITTAKIRSVYPQLQAGDIVAIATSVPGLDVTHTGFVERRADGGVGIIHASPNGSVKRSPDLQNYTSRVEAAIGIIVARPTIPH